MQKQAEIREEIDRLLEEAEVLIDRLVPIGAAQFRRRLDAAPYDDEPVTEEQQLRYRPSPR